MEKNLHLILDDFQKKFSKISIVRIIHHCFGDLSRLDGVKIDISRESGLLLDNSLIFHVTVTGRCNARCKGCINGLLDDDRLNLLFEANPEREAKGIISLAEEYSETETPVIVVFYGGEPLLVPEKIIKIQSILKDSLLKERVRFMVLTNGMLVDRVVAKYPELIKRSWLFSFSIDGGEKQHNFFRTGTDLSKIRKNIALLKKTGAVKVLIWSTLREGQSLLDCFFEFMSLYKKELADFFFYHLEESCEPYKDFKNYLYSYEKEFSYVLDMYINHLKKGEILPIIHLNELIAFLISGHKRNHTACGVELPSNFDIAGGKILACADLPLDLILGEITPKGKVTLNTKDLSLLTGYKKIMGCYKCGIEPYCGGRCPVQILTGSLERSLSYCQLLRLHVALVQQRLKEIKRLLKRINITPQHLYDHSGYLARYTDVVP